MRKVTSHSSQVQRAAVVSKAARRVALTSQMLILKAFGTNFDVQCRILSTLSPDVGMQRSVAVFAMKVPALPNVVLLCYLRGGAEASNAVNHHYACK